MTPEGTTTTRGKGDVKIKLKTRVVCELVERE
jgi:hypothetical protein